MRTAAGRDFQATVMSGTGTQPAPANFMALSSDATAPADTDTALAAEFADAGGGLSRAKGTFAHTAGSSSYTLTKTFTVNASDVLPKTARKVGVLNASAGGTLVFEDTFADASLAAVGDQVTVTVTVSL